MKEINDAPDNRREIDSIRRNNLIISVFWLRLTNEIELEVVNGNEIYDQIIPPDKIKDAMQHPLIYVNDAQRLKRLS